MGIRTVINRISGLPAQVAEALGVTVVSVYVPSAIAPRRMAWR
jgi:hypothetical protein